MSVRGAEFRKTDLQIHSPRDAGWDGIRPDDEVPNLHRSSIELINAAREKYCKTFIQKCIQEGLRAIAITDHHEGVYAYLMIRVKAELELEQGPIDLWIFPGMEITCKDSCQALILFDADLQQVLFEKARGKLGLPANCEDLKPQGVIVELLSQNLEEIQPILEADTELRNKFIILPHVKPSGHKTVLRTGFHTRFRDMPYVGGYMDQCYPHELSLGDRRILDGEIPAWSSEKRGVISTSDARHADFRLIGKHASWIKLASPTAESIRQAMLAPDSRIRHEEPKLPEVVISRMIIKGANYVHDGEYLFNQQMNSIIGGRGAGKSSLLEYLRFALGCSALDGKDASDDDAKATKRMREMLQSTLMQDSGKVVIEVLLNGALVTITREIATLKFIQVQTGETISVSTAEDVNKLIPVQPFRQGELSDLARDELADRLLALVTANASSIIESIEIELKENGQKLSEMLAKAVRLTAARYRKNHLDTEIKIIRTQIASLQKQLEVAITQPNWVIAVHDKYLDEDRNVLEIYDSITKTKHSIENTFSLLTETLIRLTESRPILEIPELQSMYDAVRTSLDISESNLISTFPKIKTDVSSAIDEIQNNLSAAIVAWKGQLARHVESYNTQKIALVGQQDILSKLDELNVKLKKSSSDFENAIQDEQDFRSAETDLTTLRNERRLLHEKLVNTIKTQIETVEAKSSGLAYAELSSEWDCSEAEVAIRSVLDLPLLREKRIEDLLNTTKNGQQPLTSWESLVDELLILVKWKEGSGQSDNKPPNTPLLMSALDSVFMDKLRTSISSDRVAGALRVVLRPKVNIYQKRNETNIEFKRASQGEQAATLLNILMNQSRGPLIIDQPEEDLDNKIINDIIKTIRNTKDDRQLILTTHNANIAVNGDSELVIEMALGKLESAGAIDELEIRNAITSTMEGGKDAFELRRKKYNF